jgi:hypothetical protein
MLSDDVGVGLRHARINERTRVRERITAAQYDLPKLSVSLEKGASASVALRPACYGMLAGDDDRIGVDFAIRSIPGGAD